MAKRFAPFGGAQTYLSDIERANQQAALANVANQMRQQQADQSLVNAEAWRQHQLQQQQVGAKAAEARAERAAALQRELLSQQQLGRALGQTAEFEARRTLSQEQAERQAEAMREQAIIGEESAQRDFARRRQLQSERLQGEGQARLQIEMLRQAQREAQMQQKAQEKQAAAEQRRAAQQQDANYEMLTGKVQAGSITPDEAIKWAEETANRTGQKKEDIISDQDLNLMRQNQALVAYADSPHLKSEIAIAEGTAEEAFASIGGFDMIRKVISGGPEYIRENTKDFNDALKQVNQAINRAVDNAAGGGFIDKETKPMLRNLIARQVLDTVDKVTLGSVFRGKALGGQYEALPGSDLAEKVVAGLGVSMTPEELRSLPSITGD